MQCAIYTETSPSYHILDSHSAEYCVFELEYIMSDVHVPDVGSKQRNAIDLHGPDEADSEPDLPISEIPKSTASPRAQIESLRPQERIHRTPE